MQCAHFPRRCFIAPAVRKICPEFLSLLSRLLLVLHSQTPLNECAYLPTNKALSTAHSIAFRVQDHPYVPCSSNTKVHNKLTLQHAIQTQSAKLMHSTASAYKMDCICRTFSSNQVADTHQEHNFIMHINTHLALPTPLPSTTLL